MSSPAFLRRRFVLTGLFLAWLSALAPLFLLHFASSLGATPTSADVDVICTAQGLARLPDPTLGKDTQPVAGASVHCPLCLLQQPPALPAASGVALASALPSEAASPSARNELPAAATPRSPAQPRAPPLIPA